MVRGLWHAMKIWTLDGKIKIPIKIPIPIVLHSDLMVPSSGL